MGRQRQMKKDVFISYASSDTDAAEKVMNHLEDTGLSCWFAPHDINPSENYHRTLVAALDNCRVVLLVLSPASNMSADVLSEIAHADLRGKQIVVAVLGNERPSPALSPLLVGCERFPAINLSALRSATMEAIARSIVAKKSKTLAILLSVIPGVGLLYAGMRRLGGILLCCGLAVLTWSYYLELGTPLDRLLACIFHSLVFCSIATTTHAVLGSISGSLNRERRWLPYLASFIVPGSGISYAGRRKFGWAFCWMSIVAFSVMMCSGMSLTIDGCCLDATAWQALWLIGIAESGFEDSSGKHRNPFVYTAIMLFVIALIVFNIPVGALVR